MSKRRAATWVLNLTLLLVWVSCGPTPVEPADLVTAVATRPYTESRASTPTAQMDVTPSTFPSANITLEPPVGSSPSQKSTPFPTTTSTMTGTPILSAPLSENGPWMLLYAWGGSDSRSGTTRLYTMNIDGTGFRALDEDTVLDYEVHPHDRRIVAYIAIGRGRNLELRLLWLPERNSMTITPLGGRSVVYEAIEGDGLAWSPDGTKIAFVGALDDSTVDVYAFDVPSGDITRVADLENYGQIYVGEDDYETESPRHASRLRWSPDGRYILFGDFTDNLGWPFSAVWAASVDGNRQMLLMDIGSEGWVVNTVGWFDPATILLLQTTGKGLPVVSINLDTGSASHILDEEIQCAAYSPRHKTWLIGLNNQQNETGEEEILQLIKPDGTRITIPDLNWSYYTWWRENDDAFLVLGGDEDYLITVNGDVSLQNPTTLPDTFAGFPQVDEYSSPNLLVSPDGSLWAWGAYPRSLISGLWVGEPYTEPAQIHFENDITEDPWDSGPNLVINRHFWTPDSQNIVLLTNNGVYLATRPEFELVKIASGVFHLDPSIYYSDETAMWLP